jgi:hypothetical protein
MNDRHRLGSSDDFIDIDALHRKKKPVGIQEAIDRATEESSPMVRSHTQDIYIYIIRTCILYLSRQYNIVLLLMSLLLSVYLFIIICFISIIFISHTCLFSHQSYSDILYLHRARDSSWLVYIFI